MNLKGLNKGISAVMLVLFLTVSMNVQVTAQDSSDPQTHEVEQRQTLFSISRMYGVTVQNLRDWNNLETDALSPGMKLFVSEPPADAEPPSEAADPETEEEPETPTERTERTEPPAITEPEATPPPQTGPEPVIHTVNPGETLFSISRRYDVSVDEIRRLNSLDSNVISVGQSLIVGISDQVADSGEPDRESEPPIIVQPPAPDRDDLPVAHDDPEEIPDQPETAEEPEIFRLESGDPAYTYHTVSAGETLSAISRQYGISVSELREFNNLRGDVISVGQELIVGREVRRSSVTGLEVTSTAQGRFYEHTVAQGESISRILDINNMDEHDFRALNPGLSPDDVRTGMSVVLLAPPTVSHSNPYRVQRGNGNSVSGDAFQASVYSDAERGQTTTSGDLYNPRHLTAAHPTLQLGSVVHVKNPENGNGLFVLVNDRNTGSFIKLSHSAFAHLGLADMDNPRVVIDTLQD